jgi:hypothetical protein
MNYVQPITNDCTCYRDLVPCSDAVAGVRIEVAFSSFLGEIMRRAATRIAKVIAVTKISTVKTPFMES